ncbi:MAG: dihydrolipoyl dehydrogenase, partial [Pseudomonadota bacterium]
MGAADIDVDVAILGAGTAGMSAYREVRKYTDRIALIDGGPLGTTCARVGCMPSKLLIAAADSAHSAEAADLFGVHAGQVNVDGRAVMARVKRERDRFVGFVEDAVEGFEDAHLLREHAMFEDDHRLRLADGRIVTAARTIIATGSRAHVPPPFAALGDLTITNDDLFYRDDLPKSVVVFGGGVIGLELGQALSRLGVRVRLFGKDGAVGPLTDPVLKAYAAQTFSREFPAVFDGQAVPHRDGDEVVVDWTDGSGETGEERFDLLLAATGRRANLEGLKLENTSLTLDERGIPVFDHLSLQAGKSSIFLAGDVDGDLPLLHEAADDGRVAGENAARYPEVFRRQRRTPLGIMFTDPGIAMAGATHRELTARGVHFETGAVSYEDQGRARVI